METDNKRNGRYDHWDENDWRESTPEQQRRYDKIDSRPPRPWGDVLVAIAIVAAIAAFILLGPWL